MIITADALIGLKTIETETVDACYIFQGQEEIE